MTARSSGKEYANELTRQRVAVGASTKKKKKKKKKKVLTDENAYCTLRTFDGFRFYGG